jgi:hypothetical protein
MSKPVLTAARPTSGLATPPRRRWGRASRWSLAMAVAWLGFVVLHRLLSGRVWWWGLVELVPPLMFLAVPLLSLTPLLVLRQGRRALAAAVVASLGLGAGLSGLNLAALWHRAEPAPPDAVTVFAWNTWYWDQRASEGAVGPPPGGTPESQVAEFHRFLRDQAADVYLLQEYLYLDADREPVAVAGLAALREAFPDHHIATAGELVTLSRFPIALQRAVDLRPYLDDHGLVAAEPGMGRFHTVKALRTDLRIGEHVVSFYNTHIHAPVEPVLRRLTPNRLSRAHELRTAGLRALAADVASNPKPVFVAGDFNTTPAMGALRGLPERLVDAGPALGSLYPTSWERRLPWWRIDWVFTTAEVVVHRYRMVSPQTWSDHSGQEVVISLR